VLRLTAADLQGLAGPGFFLRDGSLGPARARALGEVLLVRGPALRPAAMGRRGGRRDPAARGDEIGWLDEAGAAAEPDVVPLLRLLDDLASALREDARLALGRREVQVARYPGGGARYERHRDAFRDAVGPARRVTALLYLNPDWAPGHGGELRLHVPGGPVDVAPRLDRLVVFLSERVEHEVLPTRTPRLAVTAWYHAP
jgi:SM-20-related protein